MKEFIEAMEKEKKIWEYSLTRKEWDEKNYKEMIKICKHIEEIEKTIYYAKLFRRGLI